MQMAYMYMQGHTGIGIAELLAKFLWGLLQSVPAVLYFYSLPFFRVCDLYTVFSFYLIFNSSASFELSVLQIQAFCDCQ